MDSGGCANLRDLGGLPLLGGGVTRSGAVFRSGAPEGLSEAARAELGIRTVIDLRNAGERPAGAGGLSLPLDGEDEAFWAEWRSGPQFGTPLYYRPHLARFGALSARVLTAIAGAPPGGVLFHCQGGRDRTGQITMLLLTVAGVEPAAIADDYVRSTGPDTPALEAYLESIGTTPRDALLTALEGFDPVAALELPRATVAGLRARLR